MPDLTQLFFIFQKKTYQAMFGKLLSVYQKVFELVQGVYGYISHIESVKRQHVTGDLETRIPGVFWRNYFGVPYIDFFGREKLLSGTWSSVDEWPSGIIEACLSDDPADILASNEKEINAQIYLGLEYFGDIDLYQKNPRELQVKNVPKLILPDIRVDVE